MSEHHSLDQGDARLAGHQDSPVRGWAVHVLTASGAVAGLLAMVAVINRDAQAAINWLLVATAIDAIDGPLARSWRVASVVPKIDGCTLDAVVDFLTTVFVPLMFLTRFDMLPKGLSIPVVGLALFTAALWFARTDMMTPDAWFNGFPAAWNLVVPTLFLLKASSPVSAIFVVGLGVLQLSSVKFVHPVRVKEFRAATLCCTVTWFLALAGLAGAAHDMPRWGPALLFVGPVYTCGLTLYRNVSEHASAATVFSG